VVIQPLTERETISGHGRPLRNADLAPRNAEVNNLPSLDSSRLLHRLLGSLGRLSCALVTAVAVVAATTRLPALTLRLAPAEMQRALTLARWPTTDQDRARFHERYQFPVDSPTVDYFAVRSVEVITEFRRLELIAEEHARVNDTFGRAGLAEVEAALRPWRGRLSIVVSLAFDPARYIIGVPPVDMALEGPTLIAPLETTRSGVYGRGPHPVLVGGRIESTFDADAVGQELRPVFIHRNGDAIARPPIDFSKLE
jgi:hypothetical protein